MTHWKTSLLNGVMIVAAVAGCLGVALAADSWLNLGLRFALGTLIQTNIQQAEAIMYVYDSRTGWRMNPHTQYRRERQGPLLKLAGLEPFSVTLRVNGDGFIDREHLLQTPYYRIAFLGNSWVEAVQQVAENRFSALTEDYVFARSNQSKAVEIMNFGVSNAAPAQSYGVLKHFALKYKPDEVWLFINGPDLAANSPLLRSPPFGPTYVFSDANRTSLRDIRFGYIDPPGVMNWKRERDFGKLMKEYGSVAQPIYYHFSSERNEYYEHVWNDMKLTTDIVRRTAEAGGARLRLVYMPGQYEIDDGRWTEFRRSATEAMGREMAMDQTLGEKRFAALAQELGVDFISLVPVAREKGAKAMYADHFSQGGHAAVAEYLAKQILDKAPAARLEVR